MRPSVPFRAVITTSIRRHAAALRTADSLRRTHGPLDVLVAVVDDRYRHHRSDADHLDVRSIVTTHSGDGEFERLAALYTADELTDLLRPVIVRDLLRSHDGAPILSLPDDAEVVGTLEPFAATAAAGMALSVVRSSPIPRDGRLPDDVDLARHGVVDHELFAVTGSGVVVLDWWIAQARRHPLVENDRLMTNRMRWLDRAKHLFPAHVTESHGITRSYRNADASVPGSAPVIRLVDFDPSKPWSASPLTGPWPRVLISEHSDLAAAADQRSNALSISSGSSTSAHGTAPDDPFGHLSAGYPYDPVMRSLYADALHRSERNGLALPANPFREPDAFVAWLREETQGGVSRYLAGILDVHRDVADTFGDDVGALLLWARTSAAERGFSPSLTGVMPSPNADATGRASGAPGHYAHERCEAAPLSPGINLIGLFKAEMGVGEAARLTARAVEGSGVPLSLVLDSGTAHRQNDPFAMRAEHGFLHDVNVVVANADALASVVARLDRPTGNVASAFHDLATVGLWFWETELFPERFAEAFRFVDEVWVASRFVHDAIAPVAARHGVAVEVFPMGAVPAPPRMDATEAESRTAKLGVPASRFCFTFSFDHRSVAERKNPWGLVEAFTRAFPKASPNGPVLVIKSISGEVDLPGRERLRWLASRRDDIVLVEGFIDVETRHALLSRSGAYVSLHRSEGWGLTMAEALGLGVPTIATRYSGNLDFMNDANSWLIDYAPVPISHEVPNYGGAGSWADPDLDQAAAAMQRIIDDIPERTRRVEQGRSDMLAMATADAGAKFILDRMRSVRRIDLRGRQTNQRGPIRTPTKTKPPHQES